jgi:succinate-semialdehyde dehydrogenase / glutarate-semialdehyde dehydrogenase
MTIATINPATGETVERYASLSPAQLEAKLALAEEAALRWRRTPVAERARVVQRAGEILEAEKERFGTLMTLEMGKLRTAGIEEAAKCATGCRFYAEHAAEFLANEMVESGEERGYIAYQPLGVVLAIMPWNFPFWQVVRFAAPALCAGNVGLLKHASNVPRCALAIEEVFRRAGAPPGVFQALLIESSAVAGVIADDRVAAVTLTGSEGAGSSVAAVAGKHIKKTVLELGGSDPFIVLPSADVVAAATTAVKARTINNGQSCIAAKRFIVHERVAEEFERRFVAGLAGLRVGDPMDPATQVGPLASPQILEDLDRQVRESVAMGARVLTGGRRLDRAGNYYAPTVLTNIPREAPAYREETFGPVASLFRVPDLDEGVRLANDTKFGLGAAAWTRDRAEMERLATELEAGTVFINGMVASDPRFPFGGVKKSGYGRELSAIGMREFANIKTVRILTGGLGSATE